MRSSKTEAGTPNRLLLVLSDGFPYDDGYEGRYAEADADKALEELRMDGVACLCLSIGAATPTDALERVFGSASHATPPTLADLSPRMDEPVPVRPARTQCPPVIAGTPMGCASTVIRCVRGPRISTVGSCVDVLTHALCG